MRLVSYSQNGAIRPALLKGEKLFSLAGLGYTDALSFINAGASKWSEAEHQVSRQDAASGVPLSSVTLAPPLEKPSKILCIGLNYADHARETGAQVSPVPTVFPKYPLALIGNGQPIVLPRATQKPDYEVELAVVIGRAGRNIPEEKWENYVFGYTILNDVSARDVQMATSQWMMGKNFPTFAPLGPSIVSRDEVRDPHALHISLSIGGETLQDSNTRELIFKIPQLLSYISTMMPLEAGDIISTGTPSGVGMGRKPPRWLRPGDEVIARIEGLGALQNPVIAEP